MQEQALKDCVCWYAQYCADVQMLMMGVMSFGGVIMCNDDGYEYKDRRNSNLQYWDRGLCIAC